MAARVRPPRSSLRTTTLVGAVSAVLGATFILVVTAYGVGAAPSAGGVQAPTPFDGCEVVVGAGALLLDNASPSGCFVFASTSSSPGEENVSIGWLAQPAPAVVTLLRGPAIPVGQVACPLFVALLYAGNGSAASVNLSVPTFPLTDTQGCLWPIHVAASSNASSPGLVPPEVVIVHATVSLPAFAPPPVRAPSGMVEVNYRPRVLF